LRAVRATIIVGAAICCAFFALGARCFHLQYRCSDRYNEMCMRQQKALYTQSPRRGTILDARGRLLAVSNRMSVVFADRQAMTDIETGSRELAVALDMDLHVVERLIRESGNPRFAKIKVGADPNECAAARKIRGVGVQEEWIRHYPMGRLTAHTVGFTSVDHRGLEGIELWREDDLSGAPGRNTFQVDVLRRPIRLKEQDVAVAHGAGIITTIDATIQEFAHRELLAQFEAYEAESAVAIVAEPGTGRILAMVSLPDFDPGVVRYADPNTFRNRALTDQFEPGSVLKPFVAAIALDAGAVRPNDVIFCEHGSYSGKGFGRIGEYKQGFGDLSIKEILVKSSNIGMAKIGQRLGRARLYRGLDAFGFGKKTGIDLPVEKTGVLWPVSRWTGYSETRVPFGQEITVTAMQLVQAMCILANGGHLVQLHTVRAVVEPDGRIRSVVEPKPPVGYIIKPEVARWVVQEALVAVVNEGTGRQGKLKKWQVFGKTGTANIAREDGPGYSANDYVASFVCGAPAEDPRIVVLVSVRKPNKRLGKGYTGGVIAAPVAARIIEKTLTYLERTGAY